jgi:hypothetical protein
MSADRPVFVTTRADEGVQAPGVRHGSERFGGFLPRGIVHVLERFQKIL